MTLTESDLDQFTGTESYYRHRFLNSLLYTDGVKFLAEEGEAYWLIDAIASHQINPQVQSHPQLQEIQFWELSVDESNSATLTCSWDTDEPVVTQKIGLTDFPLKQVQIYVQAAEKGRKVMLLPSEY